MYLGTQHVTVDILIDNCCTKESWVNTGVPVSKAAQTWVHSKVRLRAVTAVSKAFARRNSQKSHAGNHIGKYNNKKTTQKTPH